MLRSSTLHTASADAHRARHKQKVTKTCTINCSRADNDLERVSSTKNDLPRSGRTKIPGHGLCEPERRTHPVAPTDFLKFCTGFGQGGGRKIPLRPPSRRRNRADSPPSRSAQTPKQATILLGPTIKTDLERHTHQRNTTKTTITHTH